MKKEASPFLKKSAGGKPPTRKEMKKGGLGGRGVSALLGTPKPVQAEVRIPAPPSPQPPAPAPADSGIIEVVAVDIERSPWQARSEFDETELKELSDSIRSNGIVQPPVVRRRPDGKYELIAGERRTRAAIMAGLKKIPVVLANADDRKAAEWGVIENIQRKDLNIIEEAEGYRLLKDQFGITQEDVAERVGKSRPAIANALRLLELPDEVKQLLSRNLLSAGHAKVLLSVEGERDRTLLARECTERSLTVRDLEKRVARMKKPQRRLSAAISSGDGSSGSSTGNGLRPLRAKGFSLPVDALRPNAAIAAALVMNSRLVCIQNSIRACGPKAQHRPCSRRRHTGRQP